MPEGRLGVVAIFVKNRLTAARRVNEILTAYGEIIVGRMGIPHRARGLSVMALIVDGAADTIGAMAGKLGSLPGVQVKTILAPVSVSTSATSVSSSGNKVDTTGEVDKGETSGEVGPWSGRGA